MSNIALVVEDDDALRMIYQRVLTDAGYELVEATNGVQAIEILAQLKPEVIFLDMLLPHVNGVEVLDYVIAAPHLQGVRVVIASSTNTHAQYADQYPFVKFIQKPIRPAQIRELAQA